MVRNSVGTLKCLVLCLAVGLATTRSFSDTQAVPQNAALIYMSLISEYDQNPDFSYQSPIYKALQKYVRDEGPLNDSIRECVRKNKETIAAAMKASELPDCDWQLDYAKGLEMKIPHLNTMRNLSFLVLAEARMSADNGSYKESLKKCLAAYKMGKQAAAPDSLICYLVDMSVTSLSVQNIQYVLNNMPPDFDTLKWLKAQLIQIDRRPEPSPQSIAVGDMAGMASSITKDNLRLFGLDQETQNRLSAESDEFWAKNRAFWLNAVEDVNIALKKPYPQAFTSYSKLADNRRNDQSTEATLTRILYPAGNWISIPVRRQTTINAVKTAIDVYIIKAQSGKLPDKLRPGQPVDVFSGKPFKYETSDGGFALRCQGKDLSKPGEPPMEFKFVCK